MKAGALVLLLFATLAAAQDGDNDSKKSPSSTLDVHISDASTHAPSASDGKIASGSTLPVADSDSNSHDKGSSDAKKNSTSSITTPSSTSSNTSLNSPSTSPDSQNGSSLGEVDDGVDDSSNDSVSSMPSDQAKEIHCDTNGASMCDSSAENSFFVCKNNSWIQETCDKDNTCRTVKDKAVCMDPNASISEDNDDVVETKEACDTLNATMCDSNVRSDFFMCMDFEWTKMQCDGDNVCMDRDGKTACVSQEIANKPLESCKVANATRCSESDVKGFQICIDNYWTDSSCSDDNYCLFRGDQALCVDKATAEAPVLPCKTANATRCVTDGEPVFQICYDNFWMNSTCDSNYVCGMKQGNAQCHDPEVPLIDMPDEPCSVDKAMQCVSGNETIYQVCSNKIWMSLTCDAGNVCRVQDDKVVCADKNNSDNNGAPRTLFAPEAFVAKGGAGSLFGMYSWGTAALICVSTLAFGVSI